MPEPTSEAHETSSQVTEEASGDSKPNGTDTKEDKAPRPPAGSRLEFKRVDEVYDSNKGCYILRDTAPFKSAKESDDNYREYCFTVNRRFDWGSTVPVTTIDIRSPFIKEACKTVMGDIPAVSFSVPLPKIDPQTLLLFLPPLKKYLAELKDKPEKTEDEVSTCSHLSILIDFLCEDYASKLDLIAALMDHKEITFDLYWSLLLPGTIFYTTCPVTSQPCAVRVIWGTLNQGMNGPYYQVEYEYIESSTSSNKTHPRFGYTKRSAYVNQYRGARKLYRLPAFPMCWHPQEEAIRKTLIARGKRWADLDGMHHMHYQGLAFSTGKIHINSRVIIDKQTYKRQNPNTSVPTVGSEDPDVDEEELEETTGQKFSTVESLTDDEFLMATPVLYGFSLSDKVWAEFNVDHVSEIEWNDDAFKNLILPKRQKDLIQALVESHGQQATTFDDFIKGKGRGLVVNLFGPPGIGKTMSAEATSEHVRRPLYVIGAGDLGTDSGTLDRRLTRTFEIAHTWGAVVLIDEADVFLEERSVHDLQRNALVAVFLRQLEYFAGILFLTTNRVKTFDEAFQSRIHVALRYRELDEDTKRQIWAAFLAKVGITKEQISDEELNSLASHKVNGRQIKNAVRTSQAIAASRKEALSYSHLKDVLEVMAQFDEDFKTGRET